MAVAAAAAAEPGLTAQLNELERRWADYYLKQGDAKEIARLNDVVDLALKTVQADGRFSDLTYGPMVTGRDGGQGWGQHLIRTADMFTAWRLAGTKGTGDKQLAELCRKALNFYVAAPYDKNDPWGFGHPYADLLENNRIGRACLFARSDPGTFTQQEIERWADRIILSIFKPSANPQEQFKTYLPGWEGGANVFWASRGELASFLVRADEDLRVRAADGYFGHMWGSVGARSGKGPNGEIHRLTVDGMLGEHDVPSMGAYGEWYMNDIIEYRDQMKGLERWEMPEALNKLIIDLLIDSIAHCYQGAIDPQLCNPTIWLNSRRLSNAKLRQWLKSYLDYGYRKQEMQALLDWEPGATDWPFAGKSIKAYHTTDYLTKHYPRHAVSIRAVSDNTFGMETFGKKDIRNCEEPVYLPLGTTLLRRDGREFSDGVGGGAVSGSVWSGMDFARLPGITTKYVDGPTLAAVWNRDKEGFAVRAVFGGTRFAVAVTDDTSGVYGYQQSRLVNVDRNRKGEHKASDISVDGRRSVFFLEEAIVHLGAGYDVRDAERDTYSSLEQRQSIRPDGGAEAVYADAGGVKRLAAGETLKASGVKWVHYDGVAYLPPADGRTVVQDVMQPGTPGRRVFSVYSDHGREDASLTFEYAVVPGISAEAVEMFAASRPWTVLANTTGVQAVWVPKKKWLAAVFHEPGAVETPLGTVRVDRPGALVVSLDAAGRMTLRAADALDVGGTMQVRVGDVAADLELPGGDYTGATATVTFSKIDGLWKVVD
jgi:hypothetical protein